MKKHYDLSGQRFGRLKVTKRAPNNKFNQSVWYCHCDCGHKCRIEAHSLRRGATQSCGCYKREQLLKSIYKHGHTRFRQHSPEHNSWRGMKARCTNPKADNYSRYGGKGIKICDRWLKFGAFLADMGLKPSSKHTLDRINNRGNYEPSNCRWATLSEQQQNKG